MWFVDMIYIGSRFSCSRVPKLSLPIHQRGLSRNMVDYFCSHCILSLLPRRSRWLSLGIPFRCQSYRYKIRHVTSNRCYLHYQWIVQHLFELSFVPCENLEYNAVGQWQNLRAQEFVNFLLTDRFRSSSFSKNLNYVQYFSQLSVKIRDLKQRPPRRRQQRRQKSNCFYVQNNCSARASRFLVHFFDVHCTTTTWSLPLRRFMEDVEIWRQIFLSLFEHG